MQDMPSQRPQPRDGSHTSPSSPKKPSAAAMGSGSSTASSEVAGPAQLEERGPYLMDPKKGGRDGGDGGDGGAINGRKKRAL